jgi:biopolymer transport protein ExbB/TolQ
MNVATGSLLIAASDSQGSNVLLEYLNTGGWMMYVILGVSILGLVIFLERFVQLYILRRLDAESFTDKLVTLVSHRKLREALDVCESRSGHPLVSVAREGLLRANRRDKEVERAMEKEMLSHLTDIRTRVSFLSVLANVATLLGLLGTIFGLIMAFTSVSAASAAQRQEALAAGISQAMYTTAFGIAVAVPLLLFHHFISKRAEDIIMEVESGASALLVAIDGAVRDEDMPGAETDGRVASETPTRPDN